MPVSPVVISTPNALPTFSTLNPQPIGSSLYTVIFNRNSGSTLVVYKSNDAGATWSRMDQTHEPTVQAAMTPTWIYDGSSNLLIACSVGSASGDPMQVQFYNVSTDTWGSMVNTTVEAPSESLPAFSILDSGVMVVVGNFDSLAFGSNVRAGYILINISTGAALSSVVRCGETANTTDNWYPRQMLLASGLWFTFVQSPASGAGTQKLVVQNLSGSLGSLVTVDTGSNSPSIGAMVCAFCDGSRAALAWSPQGTTVNVLQCGVNSFPTSLIHQSISSGSAAVAYALLVSQGVTVIAINAAGILTVYQDSTGTMLDSGTVVYQPFTGDGGFVNVSGDSFMLGGSSAVSLVASDASFGSQTIVVLAQASPPTPPAPGPGVNIAHSA